MNGPTVQAEVADRVSAVSRILREAVYVTVAGVIFAFAANLVSPRGLALTRNYFPTGTNTAMRAAVMVRAPVIVADTNAAVPAYPPWLGEQLKQKGLQLTDGQQAVQLFHNSRLKQGVIVFVDAREEDDYLAGHIPGAYELDPFHPEKYFPVVLPACRAAEQIVVYCNGGDCDDSQTAALLLRDVGIRTGKIFVYGGGMTEWTNYHQPLEIGPRNSGRMNITVQ
ncbi:MAG TPA: rhodanese-like domain-containing protein [Candidatus Sulfopaludibacter sp.]|nr:rhodanese-like domain-containing protein [Candidatus Sulfopaludibacter sp.]